jgi:ABC-type transport system involved in cytochrome bd biosynthesis fused ATPase/permease subunit
MSIWKERRALWQKLRRKNNDKNSQDYHDSNNGGGAITQSTTVKTTTNSEPQNAAPKSSSKKIQIITDDPAEEDALYFQGYSENLANIIREAKPKFAIGIFGKWGTGKTTLMKMIKRELDKDNEKVLTVWFDAWRYEKEKYLVIKQTNSMRGGGLPS